MENSSPSRTGGLLIVRTTTERAPAMSHEKQEKEETVYVLKNRAAASR